ncbi:hypothetical protein RJT34_10113 [Clitoria ternatea]|uniref:Uncharacterized protein n=1 Tax=Clitoria ternatea TaxID=43366 RepID=A0AAN9K5R1_CLITE
MISMYSLFFWIGLCPCFTSMKCRHCIKAPFINCWKFMPLYISMNDKAGDDSKMGFNIVHMLIQFYFVFIPIFVYSHMVLLHILAKFPVGSDQMCQKHFWLLDSVIRKERVHTLSRAT